jgi:hypothetical protein
LTPPDTLTLQQVIQILGVIAGVIVAIAGAFAAGFQWAKQREAKKTASVDLATKREEHLAEIRAQAGESLNALANAVGSLVNSNQETVKTIVSKFDLLATRIDDSNTLREKEVLVRQDELTVEKKRVEMRMGELNAQHVFQDQAVTFQKETLTHLDRNTTSIVTLSDNVAQVIQQITLSNVALEGVPNAIKKQLQEVAEAMNANHLAALEKITLLLNEVKNAKREQTTFTDRFDERLNRIESLLQGVQTDVKNADASVSDPSDTKPVPPPKPIPPTNK